MTVKTVSASSRREGTHVQNLYLEIVVSPSVITQMKLASESWELTWGNDILPSRLQEPVAGSWNKYKGQ